MADEDTNTDDSVKEEQDQQQTTQQEETQADKPEKEKRGRKSDAEKELESLREEKERIAQYLTKANKEAEKYRHESGRWKDLKDYGIEDPDEIKQILEERRQREIEEAEKAKDWDSLKQRWEQDYQTKEQRWQEQIEEYKQNLTEMQSTVESYLVNSQVKDAIIKNGGDEFTLEYLTDKVIQKSKVEKDDTGQYKAHALNDDGKPVDFDTLIKEMKNHPTHAKSFPSPDSSGSGGSRGAEKGSEAGKQKKTPVKNRSDMSQREQVDYMREHGVEAFRKLPR